MFEEKGEKVQSYATLVICITYNVIPLVLLIRGIQLFHHGDKEYVTSTLGSIYRPLKVKNGRRVLVNPVAFIGRRLWLAWLIVYSSSDLVTQMTQVFLMTGLVALVNY